jgi:exopolysaccharide biosynthesis polyprenyl glycosylphosphotransferase
LLGLVMVIAGRSASYAAVRLARRRGWVSYRTLIVGTGPTARRVARTLEEHPEHGLRVVGFLGPQLDLDRSVRTGIEEEDPGQLDLVTELHDVDVVVVTYLGAGSEALLRSLRSREPRSSYTMYLVPPLFQMLHTPGRERIRDIAVIKLQPAAAYAVARRFKRLLDVVVSLLALVVLSPVMLAVSLAVFVEVGRHVIFRQTRIGLGGRDFTLLKFRSLRTVDPAESELNWSVANDARIGPVGRFIRRTSLDELPQLFNILRGDMSLVGPRPERPLFVLQFAEQHVHYHMRHRVRPGLTGWAAVHGLRGDTSIQERAYFDNVYIDNWTLGLDFKIIVRTVSSVLGGRGA